MRVILSAERLNLTLFSEESFPATSLAHGPSHSCQLPHVLTQDFAWASLEHKESGQADCWPETLHPALPHPTQLWSMQKVKKTRSQLAGMQLLLYPTQKVFCGRIINTKEEPQPCWSNPYLHFILRVSPGKRTMWFFVMLSVGFSKNSSSARPDPKKEEMIIKRLFRVVRAGTIQLRQSCCFVKSSQFGVAHSACIYPDALQLSMELVVRSF